MSYTVNTVTGADGQVEPGLKVSGVAVWTDQSLPPNGTWDTKPYDYTNELGFINISGYQSGITTTYSNVPCTIMYDYSVDGITTIETITASYTAVGESRVAVFNMRSFKYVRIRIVNGNQPQGHFFFSFTLLTESNVSAQSINSALTRGAIAEINKSIPVLSDVAGTGSFAEVTRTGNSQNVNVTNPVTAVTVSNFPASFNIGNFPAPQPVSGTVAVSNFPVIQPVSVSNFPATQPVSISSGLTLGNSVGKTAVLKTGSLYSTTTSTDQVVLTYTVTSGKTFYLQSVDMSACPLNLINALALSAKLGRASLEIVSGTKVWTQQFVSTASVANQSYQLTYAEPLPIAAGTVIRIVCSPAGSGIDWVANFSGYEK